MAELIVTSDMALVSFIMAILNEAGLLFTVDPAYGVANAGFVNYGISSYQRIMVRGEDLVDARKLVNEAMQAPRWRRISERFVMLVRARFPCNGLRP